MTMNVDIVVDVGNTRIKWGQCRDQRVHGYVSLPPDDAGAWAYQAAEWHLREQLGWAVSGVNPPRRDRLIDWIRQRGDTVYLLDDYRNLPLRVRVPAPARVGIDRLLNAVATRMSAGRCHCIVIDAGSAVTVDWIDDEGSFRGGAIFPGLRLMAQALNRYTALLPLVEVREPNPPLPGDDTPSAIQAGVFWAVAGGIRALIRQLQAQISSSRRWKVFLTGGDAGALLPVMDRDFEYWPQMTLEGIRISAEALP
jgi:type III pantothenate kinase